MRKFHLVLGDWALGRDTNDVVGEWFSANKSAQRKEERGREWRVGQMPEWLETSLLGVDRDGIQVEVHHHGEIFRDRTAKSEVEAMQYRSEALPNFNSCVPHFFLIPCSHAFQAETLNLSVNLGSPLRVSLPTLKASPRTSSTSTTTSSSHDQFVFPLVSPASALEI